MDFKIIQEDYMKKRFDVLLTSGPYNVVLWIFAVIAPWMFYACRSGQVFIDIVVFDGFCLTLFWLMIASAAFTTVIAVKNLRAAFAAKFECYNMPRRRKAANVTALALTAVFTVVWFVMLIVMGAESAPIAGRVLSSTLPVGLLTVTAAFLLIFVPVTGKGKKLVAFILTIIAATSLITSLYPLGGYKFLAAPMVIDNGSSYSVVFATSGTGTGYIEYSYEGTDYKIYDNENGRLNNSSIHSIEVPYAHLDNNSYKVGSTRVIDELSYGGLSGKSIVSQSYDFKRLYAENRTYLCVSDWHTMLNDAYDAISHIGEYDSVILLGDALPGLQFEEEAAQYIVKFGGDVSGGVKPVIYARGNHETRGAYASSLASALGIEDFYTQIVSGDYRFIVLDSGEDKIDAHPEYGGMVDYASYRKEMINWLSSLTPDGRKTVIICHDKNICLEDNLREQAYADFNRLGASVILAGHNHTLSLDTSGDIPVFIDGGKTKSGFIASRVSLSADGISFYAVDELGTPLIDQKIAW